MGGAYYLLEKNISLLQTYKRRMVQLPAIGKNKAHLNLDVSLN